MIRTIALMTLLPCSLLAQTEAWLSVGRTGPSSSFYAIDKSTFLAFSWARGITIAGGMSFALTPSISISPEFNYGYFRWDNFNYRGAWIPEYSLRSSTGEDSHIYRVLVNARLSVRSSNPLRIFVLTGVGYTIEKIGKIQAIVDDMNGPSFLWEVQYKGESFLTHSLGTGLRFDVIDPIAIDFSAKYFTEYTKRFHTSVNAGLIYTFNR